MLLFLAGIGVGLVLAALSFIVAMCWPAPRDSAWPQFCAAVGDRPMLHPDSTAHGAVPHDWSGPIWNPPKSVGLS
jgi:hypothetical protein